MNLSTCIKALSDFLLKPRKLALLMCLCSIDVAIGHERKENPFFQLLQYLSQSPNHPPQNDFNKCLQNPYFFHLSDIQVHSLCMLSRESNACIEHQIQKIWQRYRTLSYHEAFSKCRKETDSFGDIYFNAPLQALPNWHTQTLFQLFDTFIPVSQKMADEALFEHYGLYPPRVVRKMGAPNFLLPRPTTEWSPPELPMVENLPEPELVDEPDDYASSYRCTVKVNSMNVRQQPSEFSRAVGIVRKGFINIQGKIVKGKQDSIYTWYPVTITPYDIEIHGYIATPFIDCPATISH